MPPPREEAPGLCRDAGTPISFGGQGDDSKQHRRGHQGPALPPLRLEELEGLSISVDVLSPLEPTPSETHWDVRRYGVLVDQGSRRGILLPGVEGVATAQEQIEIACRKAGIDPKSSFRAQLFQVERFGEEEGS